MGILGSAWWAGYYNLQIGMGIHQTGGWRKRNEIPDSTTKTDKCEWFIRGKRNATTLVIPVVRPSPKGKRGKRKQGSEGDGYHRQAVGCLRGQKRCGTAHVVLCKPLPPASTPLLVAPFLHAHPRARRNGIANRTASVSVCRLRSIATGLSSQGPEGRGMRPPPGKELSSHSTPCARITERALSHTPEMSPCYQGLYRPGGPDGSQPSRTRPILPPSPSF